MKKEIIKIEESDYTQIQTQAVSEIQTARATIARQLNGVVNSAYWNIGKLLFEKNIESQYGSGIVNRLSVDLKEQFPDMGLFPRNLWYMKRFYERYYQEVIKLQRCVAVLPWRHNILLLDKISNPLEAEFYANQAINKGWSKDLLLNAIKMNTFAHQIKEHSNNFEATLSSIQADYAKEVFKSSYNLGFLGVYEPLKGLDLERRLVNKIKSFIMELGQGFTFIGNQYRLEYNNKEYFADLVNVRGSKQTKISIPTPKYNLFTQSSGVFEHTPFE